MEVKQLSTGTKIFLAAKNAMAAAFDTLRERMTPGVFKR